MVNLLPQRLVIKQKRLLLSMTALLYSIILTLAYGFHIASNYYWYSIVNTPDWVILVVAIFTTIIPSFFMPMTAQKPSAIVKWFLYVMVFVPSCIIPIFTTNISSIHLLVFFATYLFAFSLLLLPGHVFSRLRISFQGLRPRLFTISVFVCTTILISFIIYVFGFNFALPSLSDVYTVRFEYRDRLLEINHRISYLIRWSLYVIGPYWIILGLIRKNPLWLSLGIITQLVIYSATGFKTSLFLIILIIIVSLTLLNGGKNFGFLVVMGTILSILGALLFEFITRNDFLSSMIIRRALVTPGLLTGYYYEFFLSQPLAFLADNKYFGVPFRMLGFEYQYTNSIPYIIGMIYFERETTSANANIWADAFANFGHIGILVYSFFLGFVLYIYDSISWYKNYWLSRLMIVGPTVALANSGLLVTMLGHGMLVAIFFLYLSPNVSTENKKLKT